MDRTKPVPEPQRIIAVLWLAFLMAGIATTVLFALIDPVEIGHCLGIEELSRIGAYTVVFFLFWTLTAASALIAVYFLSPAEDADG
ncbi:MAG: hypothetical protein ACREVH_08390 [Gammaproteobacteria bacterium]